MGTHRIYCAPEGLLTLDELPEKWALLSVNAKRRATLTFRRCPVRPQVEYLNHYHAQACNREGERLMMYSALRRMQQLRLVPANFRVNKETS